ncbi:DUF1173 family protein [Caballeronia grimmiae]|uniref:DUF1173 family protein n=1 Tax=Caballeronia grimmiae TaxID=1071679 RepID=UPI0030C6AD30
MSFDGLTVSLEDVQDNPARYARQLERAKKSPGYAVCRCQERVAGRLLRLVVRRYGALLHLARWPDDGPNHDEISCPFFASTPVIESAAASERCGAVSHCRRVQCVSRRDHDHTPRCKAMSNTLPARKRSRRCTRATQSRALSGYRRPTSRQYGFLDR